MARSYATKDFNLCQLGKETIQGTAVAATTVWRGPFANYDDTRVRTIHEEDVGVQTKAEVTIETAQSVTVAMPASTMTYEQLPYIGEAGVGTVSPTGTDPYTYTYAYPSDGSTNTLRTYTLELGNKLASADVHEIPFSWISEFTLSGKQGEAWQMQATWMGQRAVSSSFTSALSLPTISPMVFADTLLFVDDSGGTIGGTQIDIPGILMEFSLRVQTGTMWVPPGNGVRYSQAIKQKSPSISFTIRYELEQNVAASVVATERAAYEANSVRLFRLQCPGSGDRDFIMDFAGLYDKPGGYEDQDGNVNVAFEGHAVYSSADALYWEMAITNLLSNLP